MVEPTTGAEMFRSNVVWLMPELLATLTVANIQAMVGRANGKRDERVTSQANYRTGGSEEE